MSNNIFKIANASSRLNVEQTDIFDRRLMCMIILLDRDTYDEYKDYAEIEDIVNAHTFSRYNKSEYFILDKRMNKQLINKMVRTSIIGNDFIRHFKDNINWDLVSRSTSLRITDNLIEEFIDKLDINSICINVHVSENFIIKHESKIDFKKLSSAKRRFSDEFYKKYHEKMCWKTLSGNRGALSESAFKRYISKVDINSAFFNQRLSDECIKRYSSRAKFGVVLHVLSNEDTDFIIDNARRLTPNDISYIKSMYSRKSLDVLLNSKIGKKFL